jgi:acetyl esterase/lipase
MEKAVMRTRKVFGNPPRYMRYVPPPDIAIRKVDEHGVRGEWVESSKHSSPNGVFYYLHGGGYVACSPETHRPLTATLTRSASLKTFALDYRLAPENRFPAAVEDAVAGYRWLLKQGTDPKKIVISGDSAGGGLTLATLLSLRDAGEPLPAAALCLSPWTDLAGTGRSIETNAKRDVMIHGKYIKGAGKLYLGDAHAENPLASPLYGDMRGLPPLLIYVSDSEVLLDDSVRLAERAKQAGVEVDLRIWSGLPHVWPIFVKFLPEARKSVHEMAAFINQKVGESVSAEARPLAEPVR